jgi:dTDP-4-amino-4,6-dideoxygalactose transaminase
MNNKIRETFLAFGTPSFGQGEIDAVVRVMQNGWVGMGTETIAFEKELAEYIGCPQIVTVNSCTSALFLALLTIGIKEGDEVVVPSLTWCASANAALYHQAKPVFCDVDPLSMTVTTDSILSKVTHKTKAVIVVHYGGYGVDVQKLRQALPSHISIIEDAAHALGSCYPDGSKVGSSGNLTCFSFYANKNLSTAEGGAIATADVAIAERLRSLRMSGYASNAWSRYITPTLLKVGDLTNLGYKMNYTDLQAAIGRIQLARLDEMAMQRSKITSHYKTRFEELSLEIPIQQGSYSSYHSKHLYVGIFEYSKLGISRDNIFSKLRERKIGASIHYSPLHKMPLYLRYREYERLNTTEYLAENILTLPISASMKIDDVDYVVDNLEDILIKN